jgi:hypothetical protein
VQRHLAGELAVDAAQELQKLLVAMTFIAVTNNCICLPRQISASR